MYAGKNLRALLDEMKYSVARLSAALGGDIPQARIEAWIKEKGAPKVPDTKILCDFFKISSEQLHDQLLTEEQVRAIVKSRLTDTTTNEQTVNEPNEIYYLKDKISMLERLIEEKEKRLDDKQRQIEDQQKVIDGLTQDKKHHEAN